MPNAQRNCPTTISANSFNPCRWYDLSADDVGRHLSLRGYNGDKLSFTYELFVIRWVWLKKTFILRQNLAFCGDYHELNVNQNLLSRFGIERYAYTESHIGQIPCVCMYVCMYVIKLLLNH